MFTRGRIFLFACLSYILGTALASFLAARYLKPYAVFWFGSAVFFLVLTVSFWKNGIAGLRRGVETTGRAPLPRLALLCLSILFFSIWRYGVGLPENSPDKIWYYNGQTAVIHGYVADEPDVRENGQKLVVKARTISRAPGKKISGKILVTAALYPEYEYGDRLVIDCEIKAPEQFRGFAYDRYLARSDIYSVCFYPAATAEPGKAGWLIYRKIFALKKILTGLIDRGLLEPESSLARPIIFGGQRGLEAAVRNDFQKTGLTHIMAVSGFNVSLLSAMIMAALLALGFNRNRAFYLATAFLAGYIMIVGAPASARRAGLMAFLILWGLKLGRLNKITNSLALTAAILLLVNPKLLRDDVGFQLSFAAIAGLAYAYPLFEAVRQKLNLPGLKSLAEGLFITLSAQVFAWPILVYNFSQVSLIAPLANLAVLWAVPILTIVVLAALPLSFFLPAWSFLFFLPSLILSRYILAAVKFFAGFKYSSLSADNFPAVWFLVYYAAAIWLIIRRGKKIKSAQAGASPAGPAAGKTAGKAEKANLIKK